MDKTKSLIIFDVDETIIPTDYIRNNINIIHPDKTKLTFLYLKELLQQYEKSLLHFLNKLYKNKSNEIIIVTLGSNGWVNYCTSIYLTEIHKFIKNNNIKIYENTENTLNKNKVFNEIIFNNLKLKYQVILFSDSFQDFIDLKDVCTSLNMRYKTYKFVEFPKIQILENEYKYLDKIHELMSVIDQDLYIDLQSILNVSENVIDKSIIDKSIINNISITIS